MTHQLQSRPSPNFGPRRPVDGRTDVRHLVIHYTGMKSMADALARLCDPEAGVSAHYVIAEDGTMFGLVPEESRAWHAGVAFWRGTRDLNSTSIGIELVNPGHAFGYRPFPEQQIAALMALAADIMGRHNVPPHAILGHSDIAPGRKQDPGELFPWSTLAKKGIGLWPDPAATYKADNIWQALATVGYAVPAGPGADILDPIRGERDVIAAFQQRFRPHKVTGMADDETKSRIAAVASLYAQTV